VDQWARRSLWACITDGTVFAGVSIFVRINAWPSAVLLSVSCNCPVGHRAIHGALAAYRVEQVRNTGEAIIMQPKVDVLSEPRDGASRPLLSCIKEPKFKCLNGKAILAGSEDPQRGRGLVAGHRLRNDLK
jgi:hypothetical protein